MVEDNATFVSLKAGATPNAGLSDGGEAQIPEARHMLGHRRWKLHERLRRVKRRRRRASRRRKKIGASLLRRIVGEDWKRELIAYPSVIG